MEYARFGHQQRHGYVGGPVGPVAWNGRHLAVRNLGAWFDHAKDTEGSHEQVRHKTNLADKALLLQVAHGGSPPSVTDEDLKVWLAKFSQAARFLRWLALFQFPGLLATFIANGTH